MEKLTGPLQKDYKNTLFIDNRFHKERMKKEKKQKKPRCNKCSHSFT